MGKIKSDVLIGCKEGCDSSNRGLRGAESFCRMLLRNKLVVEFGNYLVYSTKK